MSAIDKRLTIEHDGATHETPIILSEQQISDGVRRVAGEIAGWMKNFPGESLQIICALNGGRPFTTDLNRELSALGVKTEIHEIKVSNTVGTREAPEPKLEYGEIKAESVRGKITLIADDIIDTCGTLNFITGMTRKLGPKELRIATVVNKYSAQSSVAHFKIHDCKLVKEKMFSRDGKPVDYWLFGYGMDLSGKYRDMRQVSWLEVPRH